MGDFRMPSLGADMEVGTIVEWRVRPGDAVHRGDIVAVVDTEKSTIEIEIFEDGIVEELLVEPGVEVPVGAPLARIATVSEAVPPDAVASAPATGAVASAPATGAFVRASPLARREAAARGIDIATLAGSGPSGSVVLADLARVATTPSAAAPAVEEVTRRAPAGRQAAMREAIGALMARSKREIPHYYLATTIDLAAAAAWLTETNGHRSVADRLLPAALLLKATAVAAHAVPVVNGFWDDGFRPSSAVHLGVAVSLRGGGLVAPAIHDADQLDLDALMHALRDVVQRAREGVLRSSEMADPTITVTNLGDQGVEEVFGVIYPPQVAIVGFGKVAERPWASDGMLGVRTVVRATLAADHRASDGHDGARFLATLDRLLQAPEDL